MIEVLRKSIDKKRRSRQIEEKSIPMVNGHTSSKIIDIKKRKQ